MVYALILLSIIFSTTGQFLQKIAATKSGGTSIKSMLFHPATWLSFACMGASAALWLVVLSMVDVSVAYPFVSLNFVLVLLLAKFYFKETVPVSRWLGAAVIMVGILLVASP